MFSQRVVRGAGAALLLVLGGCNQEGSLFENDRMSGIGGGGSNTPAVVGTWETTIIVSVEGDLQNWTTRWEFNAAGLVPTSLLRWQLTGEKPAEIARLLGE